MLSSQAKCIRTGSHNFHIPGTVERRDFYLGLDLQSILGPPNPPIVSDDKGEGEEVTGLADR